MKRIILTILHLIPFLHFYKPWSDTTECSLYGNEERQQTFCKICNKKKYRNISNFGWGAI